MKETMRLTAMVQITIPVTIELEAENVLEILTSRDPREDLNGWFKDEAQSITDLAPLQILKIEVDDIMTTDEFDQQQIQRRAEKLKARKKPIQPLTKEDEPSAEEEESHDKHLMDAYSQETPIAQQMEDDSEIEDLEYGHT